MLAAFNEARKTFRYFWREQSWEYQRIIPKLDFSCVKVMFSEEIDGELLVEHMWINDVYFDGKFIYGTLINEPNDLRGTKNGDKIKVELADISDWMFASDGKVCGGFSIQAMRATMSTDERVEHDKAWGMEFGDPSRVMLVSEQDEHPENLHEHPMSVNMKKSLTEFLDKNPSEATSVDDDGYTMLHRQAIAGNASMVEILLEYGADKNARTPDKLTALELARAVGWEHVVAVLER
ncbi:DUF2314 domain-containing protein [Campylobacter sp. faydin G-24]|uniref:DUF2314 domain-containing protein n=2 Tax=Campylobacter anatolicus TaxID=2829105 RepID=A0ABS5HJ80_9BACT|nr:DUF2314 domain-containing protein [Campylobacter anatolicus]MBR8466006.1 DUF2314 domain-containing protein [Campylobacter anatolicus]